MNNLHASSPARLGHVAIAAHHPERVAAFYRDLLDLRIVRETSNPLTGDAVLLSGDPAREDHELVFLSNRAAQHVAFRVDTREELRALYACAKNRSLPIPYALDSGVAVGFFVRDPAGNAVEIYFACGERRNDRPPLTDPVLIDELILGERGLPAVRTAGVALPSFSLAAVKAILVVTTERADNCAEGDRQSVSECRGRAHDPRA